MDLLVRTYLLLCGLLALTATPVFAQRIAILTPDASRNSISFAGKLGDTLGKTITVIDGSMSEAAYQSVTVEDPFNLTQNNAKRIGGAIGCNQFLLVKADIIRRTSLEKPVYYEAYAVIYIVSSRSGRLLFWTLKSEQGDNPAKAEFLLANDIEPLAAEIATRLKAAEKNESEEDAPAMIHEMPAENSPEAKNFRAPVPYQRIKPEYTRLAYLYGVKGTVDVLVDLDEKGNVLRTDITRWAGYGLDESVDAAVRKMNWRPAERNGKPLPIRFLLRYNFKKIENE